MHRRIICVILFLSFFQLCYLNNNIAYNIPDPGDDWYLIWLKYIDFDLECTGVFNLCTDADKERLGREAIKAIHEQMDDDKDGMVEASESRDVRSIVHYIFFLFKKVIF